MSAPGQGTSIQGGSSPLDRLRCALDTVEVDAATLRRDPRGHAWLPLPTRQSCERDAECAAELERFVARELELFSATDVGPDPFFTARVLDGLPSPLRWTGLSPSRRVLLLAGFHLMGGTIAYLVFAWLTPELLTGLADTAHAWLPAAAGRPPEAGADLVELTGWGSLAAVVAVVAFVGSKSHTSVA